MNLISYHNIYYNPVSLFEKESLGTHHKKWLQIILWSDVDNISSAGWADI